MKIADRLANEFSGPLIFSYVWWVLREAKDRGIKRLYFLARDGYTLHRVARLFCATFDLNIECRYLYCSRAALRMPTYCFLGDEAFDLLFRWGYCVSLKLVLMRAELTEQEREAVYVDCGIGGVDETRVLSKRDFSDYVYLFRNSRVLQNYICEKSTTAFGKAIGYFKQEGLFSQETLAVVDSGWTGSIQRSIRQLLEFAGYKGKVIGFYFGMTDPPKSASDGEYLTWFFNASGKIKDKAIFNNNLFECILSAPCGMTKGYKEINGIYSPDIVGQPSNEEEQIITQQSDAIYSFCNRRVSEISFSDFYKAELQEDTRRRIKRYMLKPQKEEAEYYGRFLFCDDITEAYKSKLVNREQTEKLKYCLIRHKIMGRLTGKVTAEASADLFWPCGSVAFLPHSKQWWYRANIVLWEVLRHFVKSRPNGVKNKNRT